MRIVLDACLASSTSGALEAAGHDVVSAGTWASGMADTEILERAAHEGRTLVTLDKDFGELAIVHRLPHHGIVRLVGFASVEQGPACLDALARYGAVLVAGGIVTVERTRVRVRPPEP